MRLVNRLAEPTNLHFHGLHVSPADNHDNVFVSVAPGGSFTYEITVPEGYGGTFWYHPHRHGRLARQLWQGLAGPLVIDPAAPDALAGLPEQVLVIKDISLADGRPAPHVGADWARGKSGRLVLVNGAAAAAAARSRRRWSGCGWSTPATRGCCCWRARTGGRSRWSPTTATCSRRRAPWTRSC